MINYWDACADSMPQKSITRWTRWKYECMMNLKNWNSNIKFNGSCGIECLFYWSVTSEQKDKIERCELNFLSIFIDDQTLCCRQYVWVDIRLMSNNRISNISMFWFVDCSLIDKLPSKNDIALTWQLKIKFLFDIFFLKLTKNVFDRIYRNVDCWWKMDVTNM